MRESLILAVLEIFVVVIYRMFLRRMLGEANGGRAKEFLVWTVYYILNVLSYQNTVLPVVNIFLFGVLFFIVEQILYEGNVRQKLLALIYVEVLGVGSEILTGFLVGVFGGDWQSGMVMEQARLDFAIFSKLLFFVGIKILLLLFPSERTELAVLDWLEVFAVPFLSICIGVGMIHMEKNTFGWLGVFTWMFLFLLNLITFYLYQRVQEETAEKLKQQFLLRQGENYARQYAKTEALWQELREFRHDARKRYLLEMTYLESGEYEKLKGCYQESLAVLEGAKQRETGNPCLDRMVSYHKKVAEQKKVRFTVNAKLPYDFRVQEQDLYILLGNLLDNAVDAAEGLSGQGWVRVSLMAEGHNLCLCVENSYKGELRRDADGHYLSGKTEPGEHGYGLRIAEKIVEKYHGRMQIGTKNGQFQIVCLLYEADIPD